MNNNEILINRMFSGDYLQYNIGHEVINLFLSDDGSYYVYINDDGTLGEDHYYKTGEDEEGSNIYGTTVKNILLARTLENENSIEIIGVASGLTPVFLPGINDEEQQKLQQKYARKNNVKYGGVNINDIYKGGEQQIVNITFKADCIKKVKEGKRIYIRMAQKANMKERNDNNLDSGSDKQRKLSNVEIQDLESVKLGRALKSFINEEEHKTDYKTLELLINDKSLWENGAVKKVSENSNEKLSYLDICKRSYEELAYSNAMLYFTQKYPEIAFDLFDTLIKRDDDKCVHEDFVALREKKHMDLLFYNENRFVVVENKIKSGINGVREIDGITQTQLDDYVIAVREVLKDRIGKKTKGYRDKKTMHDSEKIKNEKNIEDKIRKMQGYYIIIAPNYNPLMKTSGSYETSSGIKYKLISYGQLYNCLEKYESKDPYRNDDLFVQFIKSIQRHVEDFDDGIYNSTLVRFIERIQYIQRKKLYT